jgi:hypothetical protein
MLVQSAGAARKRYEARRALLVVVFTLFTLVTFVQVKRVSKDKRRATPKTFTLDEQGDKSALQPQNTPIIACWVLRANNSVDELLASEAILNGWGRGCSTLEFIDANNTNINVDWEEGYGFLAGKSFRAWHFMYEKHVQNRHIDFILKADIDTYVLWGNLERYLANLASEEHHYIGKQLVRKHDTLVAGPCIVLSRKTLEYFVDASHHRDTLCTREDFLRETAEDVALAKCLHSLHILPRETRDVRGAERFMSFDPTFMSHGPLPRWYKTFSQNKIIGKGCCSSEAIAFHYVSPENQSRNLVFRDGYWSWEL